MSRPARAGVQLGTDEYARLNSTPSAAMRVEMRRADDPVAGRAQAVAAVLVGHQQDDVRAAGGATRRSGRRPRRGRERRPSPSDACRGGSEELPAIDAV